jgi:hypothetical protein
LTPDFRCAAASADRAESLAGTASTVRSFLLVEDPGPWGVDALADSRLPAPVRRGLLQRADRSGVRVLLVRRHGRSSPSPLTVFAAHADPVAPWTETTEVDRPEQLLDLDLAAVAAGQSPGLRPHQEPLFLVCTHGRHDACCAERGRPVAAALSRVEPEATWEVSHIGGDRFAGNMLVLPEGLYYGRLSPEDVVAVAAGHREGRLSLPHLRGRCSQPFAVQAAEGFLRSKLGLSDLSALALDGQRRDDEDTVATFSGRSPVRGSWQVRVRTTRAEATQLTCRAARRSPPLVHTLVSLTAV